MTNTKNKSIGLPILVTASFFYALYGVFSKVIGNSFAPFYQAWTRSLITVVLFLIFGLATSAFKVIRREDLKWFLVIGVFGSLAIAPLFYALAFLHLGTALFLHYAATVITSYTLGFFIFKERLTTLSLVSLFLACLGISLVYSGDIYFNRPIPVLGALISGVLFSIYFVYSKKVSSTYSSVQINTIAYIFGVLTNLFISLGLKEEINTNFLSNPWIANFGYSLAGFIASGLTILGFKYIEAHKGSLVLLSEILFGLLLGFFFFEEVLNTTTIFGGTLIVVSLVLPNIKSLFSKK